jgi:hypothetical protein
MDWPANINDARNPYHSDSPEWQLYENMLGNLRLEQSNLSGIRKAQDAATAARNKAQLYKDALDAIERCGGKP